MDILREYGSKILYHALISLGVVRVMRRLNRDKWAVLMYHNIVPDECPIDAWTLVRESAFRKQMELLKQHYDVVPIGDLIHDTIDRSQALRKSYKPKAVITFDDGYRNNYTVALPILKEFNFPATVFVCSGFLNSTNMAWYDKVIYAIQRSSCNQIELDRKTYSFKHPRRDGRWDRINTLLTDLKAKTGHERAVIVEEIETTLQVEHDQNECFAFLSDGEVKEMHQSGLITIGAHTANHELLTQVSLEEAEKTVMKNYQDLRTIIDHDVFFISYPNGNYNMKILELMHALPFKAACTTKSDLYSRKYTVFEVPRIGVGGYDSNANLLIKMSGLKKMLSL